MFPLCSPGESLSSLCFTVQTYLGSHYQGRLDMKLISVWITSNTFKQPWQSLMFPLFNHFIVFMFSSLLFYLFMGSYMFVCVSALDSGRSVFIREHAWVSTQMESWSHPQLMDMQMKLVLAVWMEYGEIQARYEATILELLKENQEVQEVQLKVLISFFNWHQVIQANCKTFGE